MFNTSTATVDFGANGGDTFYIFGADLSPSLFVIGAHFQLTVWFGDSSIATATTTLIAPPTPTLTLSYRGKVRDRVGKGNTAVGADGDSDGVFAVKLEPGGGSRTILQMELRRTSGGDGVWDANSSTNWWVLGAAGSLDGPLYNNSAAAVNFSVGDGETFYIFGGDLNPSLFVGGTQFQVTVWFADLSTATASTVMTPANTVPPKISGLANEDEVLSATPGSWAPEPSTKAIQWQRCDANGTACTDVAGQTGAMYNVGTSDFGATLRIRVTATNVSGSTIVNSRVTPIVLHTVAALGLAYRPALLFDLSDPTQRTNETWRPLRITAFANERAVDGFADHTVCSRSSGSCAMLWTAADLTNSFNSSDYYIDIGGRMDDPLRELQPAISPCNGPTDDDVHGLIRDCDGGTTSAIYYEPGQDRANYRYFDYWWFFRFNEPGGLFGPGDNHAGDWEGTTIVLDPLSDLGGTPETPVPVFGLYATHYMTVWVRWDALPLRTPGHTSVYVARGTHASYSFECPVPQSVDQHCYQPAGSQWTYESPHDGGASWGNNDDYGTSNCQAECAIRFPTSGWPYWPGRWGEDIDPQLNFGDSPTSPGLDSRFTCAASGQDEGTCARPPGGRPLPPLGYRASRPASVPDVRSCASWLGFGITAIACDPQLLRRAIREHRFRAPGWLRLRVPGHRSGSGPGLAQVTGEPLTVGETISVLGQAAPRTRILVQVRFHQLQRYVASFPFSALSQRRSPRVLRLVARNGRPAFMIGQDLVRATFRRGR
ncbi:MAG TPA: hypothetical protein VF101_11910 [Gaiellaceae bacterium]